MAKEYEMELIGQPYFGRKKERIYAMNFTEPEAGINENTGILLIIAGFGGNRNSNVYKKIRNMYSDKYNLVVVQSDYMGSSYMQKMDRYGLKDIIYDEKEWSLEELELFLESGKTTGQEQKSLDYLLDVGETEDDFCELGVFQAMDNIRCLKVVTDIIEQNGLKFNRNKVIAFGDSHGAYLAYLGNALCPNLFSAIIDNSAWIVPRYLKEDRGCYERQGQVRITYRIEYRVLKEEIDSDIYDLMYLYQQFENQANIYSFHGIGDMLVPVQKKENLCKIVENMKLCKVGEDIEVGEIFHSTEHSCGTDYLKLLDFVFQNYELEKDKREQNLFEGNTISTEMYEYKIIINENACKIERLCKKY